MISKEELQEIYKNSHEIEITEYIQDENVFLKDWFYSNENLKTHYSNIQKEGLYWILSDFDINTIFNPPEFGISFNSIICNNCKDFEKYIISKKSNEIRVVYNGHAHNLKERFRQHFIVNSKETGALNISENCRHITKNQLRWVFKYYHFKENDIFTNLMRSKNGRQFIENSWRTYNGFPILCKN